MRRVIGIGPRYDHYYRDVWFGVNQSFFSWMDKDGSEAFNPHYADHHH